jgi:hypothetical protein
MLVVGDAVKGDGRAPRASEARRQKEQKNLAASLLSRCKKGGGNLESRRKWIRNFNQRDSEIFGRKSRFGTPQPPNASQAAHEGTF